MRNLLLATMAVTTLPGCAHDCYSTVAPTQQEMACHGNPTLLPVSDPCWAWETVVDVVDDYFRIEREEPVRVIGTTITEGRLDTYPKVASTIFEPWHLDSAGAGERTEATLQSMRRHAVVRVIPSHSGYWVDVAVFKELEDVIHPEHATAGAATFRYDDTLSRVINPVGGQQIHDGWIPRGRDRALEQRIISHLQSVCSRMPAQPVMRGNNSSP